MEEVGLAGAVLAEDEVAARTKLQVLAHVELVVGKEALDGHTLNMHVSALLFSKSNLSLISWLGSAGKFNSFTHFNPSKIF